MRRWPFGPRYPVCRTVIVNLKSGRAFRGVLWARRAGFLVLRNAEALPGGGKAAPVDGELAVPEGNVDFLQVVSAP